MRRPRRPKSEPKQHATQLAARLRVIGGSLRGRTILYNGDPNLRPMKDRVRESLFNLLGPHAVDKNVLDLFAGTGALSFEAISRGARSAVLVERRFPNVRIIEETAASLAVVERVTVVPGDAFRWAPHRASSVAHPWLVFCCPPYDFYVTRRREMVALIEFFWQQAAADDMLVVESDQRFAVSDLPAADQWQVREYPPAVLSLVRKPK